MALALFSFLDEELSRVGPDFCTFSTSFSFALTFLPTEESFLGTDGGLEVLLRESMLPRVAPVRLEYPESL